MFLIWFLSGFVMMYKHFPNIGNKEYKHQTALPDSISSISSISKAISKDIKVENISIEMFREKPIIKIKTSDREYQIQDDSTLVPLFRESIPFSEIETYARRWNVSQIKRVDTLHNLDQWIPTSEYKSDLPIYKFRFADKDKTYLYVSSVTGKAVQCVTAEQRFWSWLGPIPHFIYIWQLRQNRDTWSMIVSCIAGAGALMCLVGIILGIRSYILVYLRRKKFATPYKKFYFKWHHILGFFFGFFVLMFAFSGMMSLNDLPQWIVKTHDDKISKEIRKESEIDLASFQLDYNKILREYKGKVKEIVFNQYSDKPYYSVVLGDNEMCFDASDSNIKPLFLSEKDVLQRLSLITNAPKTIHLMKEFDNYYVGFTKRMQLPVYKVRVADADESVFYVNPKTTTTRYYNKNKRAGKWIYPAFHSLRFKFFAEHTLLKEIVLWIMMIGGTLVSFTGVVLGFKYLYRLITRRKKQLK